MSLTTEWQARLSSARRIQLTNPDTPSASTEDATRLAAAVADTQANFAVLTGATFDATNAQHIAAGIRGVTAFLVSYGAQPQSEYSRGVMKDWRDACAALTSLAPGTTSLLTPSTPDTSGGPIRPDFDRENVSGIIPRAPVGGAGSSFLDTR